MDIVDIPIEHIFLDSKNPRHDAIETQQDIVKELLDNEYVLNLAEDIAEFGTNPLQRLAVLKVQGDEDKYIALEGNRRVCALKLLHDPARAPKDNQRQQLRKLARGKSVPDTIPCVVFDDRLDAVHWLQVIHDGEQKGVGVRNWRAQQKVRFNQRYGQETTHDLSHLALEYASKQGIITEDERRGLAITTLTRYLSNPLVRNALGITDNRELRVRYPLEEFNRVLGRFLTDAIGGRSVHSRSKKEDREAYARRIEEEEGTYQIDTLSTPIVIDLTKSLRKTARGKTPGRRQHPDSRMNLISRSKNFYVGDNRIDRLVHELKNLRVDGFEFSTALTFRVFIEAIFRKYADKAGIQVRNKGDLHKVIQKVEEHLRENSKAEGAALKPLRVAANTEDSLLSPSTFGAYAHGTYNPTKSELMRTWDSYEKGLELVVDFVKEG